MSILTCEACVSYGNLHGSSTFFRCRKGDCELRRYDMARLPRLGCYRPKPKPESACFEKAWREDNERLCLTGDAKPRMIYTAGWRAAIGEAMMIAYRRGALTISDEIKSLDPEGKDA